MTLLCIFKGLQNEHLGSKDFELVRFQVRIDVKLLAHTEQRKRMVREKMWSGNKGKSGALVNTSTLWTGRVRGACKEY